MVLPDLVREEVGEATFPSRLERCLIFEAALPLKLTHGEVNSAAVPLPTRGGPPSSVNGPRNA